MMATTEPENIPQTIRSRCQHFSFHAVKFDDILAQLKQIAAAEEVNAEEAALALLAEAGDGSMRDALSIMDQAIASAPVEAGRATLSMEQIRELMGSVPNAVFERLLEAVAAGQSIELMNQLNTLLNAGNSPSPSRARWFATCATHSWQNLAASKPSSSKSPPMNVPAPPAPHSSSTKKSSLAHCKSFCAPSTISTIVKNSASTSSSASSNSSTPNACSPSKKSSLASLKAAPSAPHQPQAHQLAQPQAPRHPRQQHAPHLKRQPPPPSRLSLPPLPLPPRTAQTSSPSHLQLPRKSLLPTLKIKPLPTALSPVHQSLPKSLRPQRHLPPTLTPSVTPSPRPSKPLVTLPPPH